jgi:hypothetical protein
LRIFVNFWFSTDYCLSDLDPRNEAVTDLIVSSLERVFNSFVSWVKVRQTVICGKSKIYKNSQCALKIKITASSSESVEKCIIYSQLRDLTILLCWDPNFSKIHKIVKEKTKKKVLWFMNPRSIHVVTLREWLLCKKFIRCQIW